ncbi:type II toxin-antitoxin system PemK/MazF family toxin [Parafrigoribacterium humi]|uniref:type II toxin-antitoxin system PemK/MazF family toxin n=1 Tax=Parafrigoribacterium humi TaxID=3144664 RepID=UPI0032EBB16B
MRPVHLATLDNVRPVIVLMGEGMRPYLSRVTVATITTTVRGLQVGLAVGQANGLDHDSVISCDNITTIPVANLGKQIGFLPDAQETLLTEAVAAAFDLES